MNSNEKINTIMSLKCLCLVKIATYLSREKRLIIAIEQCPRYERINFLKCKYFESTHWKGVQKVAYKRISNFILPGELKVTLLSLIFHISQEILIWMEIHSENKYLCIDLPGYIFWTQFGTINYEKLAVTIVNDERLCIRKRYKLACIYCFKEEILQLWEEMTDNDKEYFQCKGKSKKTVQEKLVAFWTDDYINDFTLNRKVITADRCASLLYSSAIDGNLVATKFFFQKIFSEDSDVAVFDAVNVILKKGRHRDDYIFYEKGFGEVLNFLVPNMDERNRTRIFLSNDKEKLYKYFLHYSRPNIFLKFVKEFKAAFRADLYVTLLNEILFKYLNGYINYNYQLLFKRFWKLIPKEFQNMISRFSPVGGSILFAVVKRKFPFMLEESILVTYELSNRIKMQTSGVIRGSHLDKYKFFTYLILEGICTVESLNRVQDKFSEDLLDIGEDPPLVFNCLVQLINEIKDEPYKLKDMKMTELEREISD